ncbi:MAG: ribosome assembly RNA-binding protein YhbY [Woeseia sp.]|nr:ribosome assembly RNA-binding protein YhbY [Woeseia sp.]|tara:strand:+ start:680 stop:982 length:303 start_codon:yes stop_codon:yes gene_type:complete
MDLSEKQKKYLRGLGHRLKPTILIGAGGLKNSVIKEFESTIDRHELVKVRTRVGNREKRNIVIDKLCDIADCTLIQRVGNIALIYRPNKDMPIISLPTQS